MGGFFFFCLKELYSYGKGERIEREWICSLRYHLKRGRGGYKLADVSHLSRESQAVETFLLQKLHPNSDAHSAPCTWARRERRFHRQKWTLKSVSALVTIRI